MAVERPFARGLAFKAGYTWATSMDDTSAFLATDGDDNTPQNSRDLAAEWGPSGFDVRHRLVASASWNVPAAAGAGAAARTGRLSGILTAQSGRPFTPRVSFDNSNTGNTGGGTFAYDRPNVVTGTARQRARTGTYDGQVFAIAPHTRSERRPQQPDGPGYASLDFSVSKRMALGLVAGAGSAAGNLQRAVAAEPEPAGQLLDHPNVDKACRRSRRVRRSSGAPGRSDGAGGSRQGRRMGVRVRGGSQGAIA